MTEIDTVCDRFAQTWEHHLRPTDEVAALAILFSSIGVRNQQGLWQQALAVDYLVELMGSRRAVAEAVGAGYSTIRDRHILLELPGRIKLMLA